MKKALIVVDVQNDFCPGGSLAVPEGDKVIPVINKLFPNFDLVIFTKDWHNPEMEAFASQHTGKKPFEKYTNSDGQEDTLWPDHCVANTPGADLHKDIDFGAIPKDFYIFKKGTKKDYHPYSGFGETELQDFLESRGINQVFITGLALDYCVKDTALDAVEAGFDTYVIEDACASIDPDINPTLREFNKAGISFIESFEIEQMKQQSKSIYDFKKGDIITRLEPMVEEDGYKDFSLVGAKLTFVGIANACAYLMRKANPLMKIFLGQDTDQLKIPLALCESGWAIYVEPDFLDNPIELTDEKALEEEIKKAVEEEDYFKAEALRKKLEEIRGESNKN